MASQSTGEINLSSDTPDEKGHVPKANDEAKPVQKSNSEKMIREENGSRKRKNQVESLKMSDKIVTDDTDGIEEIMSKLPCYQRLHHSFCFKVFVFLLVFVLDAADLISDWLLYSDVSQTEEGLVYGPPEDALTFSLLAFSIIGSLTFIFEIVNLWWEVFRNNPWIDSDLSSAVTVWIEDVPQIIINIFIAACREEAISYFQLVKASVIIFSCIIRIVVSLVRYCSKKALIDLEKAKKNSESCRHVVYRVFIMVGLFITFAGSITVFMFTQSERNPDGSLNFKVPHTIVQGKYDDHKYFKNVSVFFSHPLFDYNSLGITETNANWIRVTSVDEIRNANVDGTLKFQYDDATKTKIVVYLSDSAGTMNIKECYTIDRTGGFLTLGTNCGTLLGSTGVSEYTFRFHFTKPKLPGLIFGDITYNVKVKENGTCHNPSSPVYDVISKRTSPGGSTNAVVHYFRTKDGISNNNHVILLSPTTGTFYRQGNLTDISSVWKTGFAYCSSTGSLAPHRDTTISITC